MNPHTVLDPSPVTERPLHSSAIDTAVLDSVHAALDAVLRTSHSVAYHRAPEGSVLLAAGTAAERRVVPAPGQAWEALFLTEIAALLPLAEHGRICFSIAFDPAHGMDTWPCFSPIRLSIPRCVYHESAGSARVFRAGDETRSRALSDTLLSAGARQAEERRQPLDLAVRCDQAVYFAMVEEAIREMKDGRLAKIVLADECVAVSAQEFDVAGIVAALDRMYPTCHTFLVSPSCPSPNAKRVAFLGATPELLARVSGGRVSTMALAGTAHHGQDADREKCTGFALDEKIEREHRYVVDMITRELAQICESVSQSDRHVVDLPNVRHFRTTIDGVLADGRTLADVVACLHPTPAVCGTPRTDALTAIRALERVERGLFSGVAGWMNEAGEGEAVVTLRSALLEGARGRVFAGAGILPDSDPAQELSETRLKMRAMLAALEQR